MPWRRMGEWRCYSSVFDLGTRWRWVVSFTSRPLYSRGKSPEVPIGERVRWTQEPVWTLWSRENLWPLPGTEPRPSSLYPVAIQTELLASRKHRSTRRKPIPVSLCPPQISHELSYDWNWVTVLVKTVFPDLTPGLCREVCQEVAGHWL
jgi:hypothetical protein